MLQLARASFRDADPPHVLKSKRGEYALDDHRMVAWYQAQVAAKAQQSGSATGAHGLPAP